MEPLQVQNKLILVFQKIVQPNFVLDNYYAESLIKKLSRREVVDFSCFDQMPLMTDWLNNLIEQVEKSHVSVKVFVTRLAAVAVELELRFSKLNHTSSTLLFKSLQEINSPTMNPSLVVANMEVALAIVKHTSGINALLRTGVWKEILSFTEEKRTVYVTRQSYKFASRFLWKLNDMNDEENIKVVLAYILKPFFETDFINATSVTSEDEDVLCKSLEPTLHMFLATLSEVHRIIEYTMLMNIIIKEFNLMHHFFIAFDHMRRKDISFLLSKVMYWIVLSKVFLAKPKALGVPYVLDDFMELAVMFFNTFHFFIQRRSALLVLDFCNATSIIWNAVWKDMKSVLRLDGTCVDPQNQKLFLCLVPCLVYLNSNGQSMSKMTDERVQECISKLLNTSCEHTSRAAYALRDLTLELDTLDITLKSVKRLSCLHTNTTNAQANLVFQILYYILDAYDTCDENGESKIENDYEESSEKLLVMTHVLETILMLVKDYDIHWHKSLEIICLYSVVFNLLRKPNLTCRFVVTALNIVGITVRKFLQPNLALLMESKPGSAMHDIGKLIYMKMHDFNWEVRDSALELLLDCTKLSFIKFPPFQKTLIENNLINVAATIAFNDHQYYVQATALKCIGAASKISNVWASFVTQFPNIKEQLLQILCNNHEGVVRKEACNVLSELYQNLKLIPEIHHMFYQHMVSAALSDFHWEVQLSALKFWKIVIQSLLTGQGMLDGTFPPVTFSRESRKIVNLNKTEIQRRLIKVLDELALHGCLTVLVKLVQDDTDVEIMDAALTISLDLLEVLNHYNVVELLKSESSDAETIEEILASIGETEVTMLEDAGVSQSPSCDKVIESILNSSDINLLASIYESHLNMGSNTAMPKVEATPKIRLTKLCSPHLFVTYMTSKDFKVELEEKRKWNEGIKSLSSLLDDVTGVYEVDNEVNGLDCY